MTLHRRVVRIVSRLVPRRFRSDWEQEWDAELQYREARLAGLSNDRRFAQSELIRRSAGSVWDALAMQPRRLEEDMYQDVRYGLRTMWRNKGWTLVVVLSLAIGIGANTALFSVVDAALFRKLPAAEPDELVFFEASWRDRPGDGRPYAGYSGYNWGDQETGTMSGTSLPYLAFERFRSQSGTLDDVIAFAGLPATVRVGEISHQIPTQVVSGNYYTALGVPAAIGRMLLTTDDQPDAEPAAVISHAYWERQFGSDPSVIGRTIVINGLSMTIVGVSAAGFTGTQGFGTTVDISVPIAFEPVLSSGEAHLNRPWVWWVQAMGRMRPDATREQVQAELEPIFQASAFDGWSQAPRDPGEPSVLASDWNAPGLRVHSGALGIRDTVRTTVTPLIFLSIVSGFVLLMVCTNVANLVLARSTARWREVALRIALGAGRLRLVRQVLTEGVVLAGMAGILGVGLAYWGKELVAAIIERDNFIANITPRLHFPVLAFAAAVSLLTAVLFSLAPALRHTSGRVAESGIEGRRNDSPGRLRWNRALVVLQVAMSIVLLISAGLLVRTVGNLRNVDVGFDARNLLLFRIVPEQLAYDEAEASRLYDEIRQRIDALPGVAGTTLSNWPLVSAAGSSDTLFVEGGDSDDGTGVRILRVQPNFLRTMEIPLRSGRDLAEADDAGAPPVALISEALAARYFPSGNPIGRRLGFGSPENRGEFEIVGIVPEVRVSTVRLPVSPVVYLSRLQEVPASAAFVLVRATVEPASLVVPIQETMRRIDPDIPVPEIRTQYGLIETGFAEELFMSRTLGAFGLLALALASIGLFGLLSYSVASRVPEIGIRMALGARRREVIQMIMQETSTMLGFGLALGLAGAYGAARLIRGILYGVDAIDPPTIAGAVLLLVATAGVAAFLPARRASRVDPMEALRHD